MSNQIKCPKCGEIFTIDESSYADIVKQIRDDEFKAELEKREEGVKKVEQLNAESRIKEIEVEKDREISKLRAELTEKENEKTIALINAENKAKAEISELKSKINAAETEKKLALTEALSEKERELSTKNEQIAKLQGDLENIKKDKELSEKTLKESYKLLLDEKDKNIEQLRDLKSKMSTKMIGETLEQHCETEFNIQRAASFPRAYFEKDNDIKTGSKGDYIFRDYSEDGTEFISIMFEMKNEMETTEAKHKNEDFFKKLDKDRKDKGCEYAVLVSMLEADSELYNTGIVDVSHRYEKMYVIRPQFFIPMITLLRNAARNSLSYKQALIETQNRNIDITNFENDLNAFKESFSRSVRLAGQNFETAMNEIDNTIKHLEKVREALRLTQKQLLQADGKAEDLTIQKLTKNNPTMRAKFAELSEENK
ncbi:MAG: DUF2130 domain-containing protein [Clostridia bacterium]|nr:DUF2130 domain-containing protein [Clostridia bacterium]